MNALFNPIQFFKSWQLSISAIPYSALTAGWDLLGSRWRALDNFTLDN